MMRKPAEAAKKNFDPEALRSSTPSRTEKKRRPGEATQPSLGSPGRRHLFIVYLR